MADEYKSHTEGAILKPPIEADERIIYDYPAYYYNRKRANEHYARDFAHRLLGVTYKSPYGVKK